MGEESFRNQWQTVVGDLDQGDLDATYKGNAPLPEFSSLDHLPWLSLSGNPPAPADPTPTDRVPQVEIIDELAKGGMGIVYSGRQQSLKRRIALKRLHPEMEAAHHRDRFVNEALVTGYLEHPNIVPIHELGRDSEGNPLICMKLIKGETWKERLKQEDDKTRRANIDQHLRVLIDVCDAIEYAHTQGFLHLDLKPDNIMVGRHGEVMVMDWGIAIDIRDQPDGKRRTLSREEVTQPMGTPGYMAPELATGEGQKLGPWTDVYLLGSILCEILTGHAPHKSGSFFMTLLSAREGRLPPLGRGVPRELKKICHRAMAAEPKDRYASVAEFRQALVHYLAVRDSRETLQVSGLFVALLAVLAFLSFSMLQFQEDLNDSQNVRYHSYRAAEDLRQSSEDLTSYARAYAATGDARYEDQYWQVLEVRNGNAPREDGRLESLRSIMADLGVTDAEFALLTRAEDNSNALVLAENRAFQAMKGHFPDDQGDYTVQGDPDPDLALELLVSDEYYDHKAEIMGPIDEFEDLIEARTDARVTQDLIDASRIQNAIVAVAIFLVVLSLAYAFRVYRGIRRRLESAA